MELGNIMINANDVESHNSEAMGRRAFSREEEIEIRMKEKEDAFYVSLAKCVGIMMATIIFIPFIVCNIYYIRVENTCSIIKPHSLRLSLKEYLIVSTLCSFIIYMGLVIYLLNINLKKDIKYKFMFYLTTPFQIFIITWDILGAIVFWGYIVNHYSCSHGLSDYLHTIFIMRFVILLFEKTNNAKNK
jgi:hypothetical protein